MVTATSTNVNHGSFIFGLQRGHYLTGAEGANLQSEAKLKPEAAPSEFICLPSGFALCYAREEPIANHSEKNSGNGIER